MSTPQAHFFLRAQGDDRISQRRGATRRIPGLVHIVFDPERIATTP